MKISEILFPAITLPATYTPDTEVSSVSRSTSGRPVVASNAMPSRWNSSRSGRKPIKGYTRSAGATLAVVQDHRARRDLGTLPAESRLDLPGLDAILEIGAQPILHALRPRGAAVDDRRAGAGAKQLQRRFDRGVLAADHDDVHSVGVVGFVEIVMEVRKIFALHAEPVGLVEVAGREHERITAERFAAVRRLDVRAVDQLRVEIGRASCRER